MKLHEKYNEDWYRSAAFDIGSAPASVGYGVLNRPKYKGVVQKTIVHHSSNAYPGNDTVLCLEYLDGADAVIASVMMPVLYDYKADGSFSHRPPEQIPLIGAVEHWDTAGNVISTEADYCWKLVPPPVYNDGGTIARRRKEKGMTQQQLADAVGVTQTMVARWETGKATPGKAKLDKLRELLGK